jgi:hypothetical protein
MYIAANGKKLISFSADSSIFTNLAKKSEATFHPFSSPVRLHRQHKQKLWLSTQKGENNL